MKYIFLHGLGQTPSSWNGVIQAMKIEHDVICPNLSSWIYEKNPDYQNLYGGLESLCSSIDEPLCLIGLSLGGMLALQYSIEHKEKVKSLVVIGTQYKTPKFLIRLQNLVFRFIPKSTFAKNGFTKNDFLNLCKSMLKVDFSDKLSSIECDVLIVCGEKDKVNMAAGQRLNKMITKSKIAMISKAGHEVNIDNPIKLGNELKCFFADLLTNA